MMPEFYLRIMPSYLPYHEELVALSGIAEIALGLLTVAGVYLSLVRWGLIMLLVAVFPANVEMALHTENFPEFSPILIWLRLPLQIIMIYWVSKAAREKVGSSN